MKSNDIIHNLIEKITSGEIPISSRIPSESQLAIKYQCNRHTIRKVISHLIERAYLLKASGGSTFVNDFTHYKNNILFLSSLGDFFDPKDIRSDVNKLKIIKASDKLSKLLHIEQDSKVWSIVRVRYIDSAPTHMEEIYMPYSLFPELTRKDCESSLLSYIESQYDYKISHGIKNVSAIKLTNHECKLLALPDESIVMQVENTGYLTNGRVYEYSISKSRENKFCYYCRR